MSDTLSAHPAARALRTRLEHGEPTRIVGFGSSNTEARAECRFNWLDWLDYGLHRAYGRFHRTINSGVSGNTTGQMLERFDEDVALYRPHVVFVTAGGNDSAPEKTAGEEVYRANLLRIAGWIRDLGAAVVFQTYYAVDLERMEPPYAAAFPVYMEIVREVAAETGDALIDHYSRWERLRLADLERYRALMLNPLHVNASGNMLMGADVLRALGVPLTDEARGALATGLELQAALDDLAR